MKIDAEIAEALAQHELLPPIPEDPDPNRQARASHERDAVFFTPHYRRPAVADIEERHLPGPDQPVPVRIYRPEVAQDHQVPTVLWIHGGGWVTGSLHTGDALSRAIADGCDAVVVSVDYRLAPEHPWPAGLDDVVAAFSWLRENIGMLGGDLARIGVGGDSAGGNLAAILAQQARDESWPLRAQLLVYPVTDCALDGPYGSRSTFVDGPYVSWTAVAACIESYLPDGADPADPRISPLKAASLKSVAPAVIATVELDPLRDEGHAYAHALQSQGVRVVSLQAAGLPHGGFDMGGRSQAAHQAVTDAVAAFRELLSDPTVDDAEAFDPDEPAHNAARFLHLDKAVMLARSPLVPQVPGSLAASLGGYDPHHFTRISRGLAYSVQRAAEQLLADPEFSQALESLPLAPGERIVALGDSITDDSVSWAEQLKAVLALTRPDVTVLNHGVTGATTHDHLARVDLLVQARPTWVIQLLGTNDVRRQGRNTWLCMVEPEQTARNLEKLAQLIANETGARLTRMAPPPVIEARIQEWEPFAVEQISWRARDVENVAATVLQADPPAINLAAIFAERAEELLLPDGVHPNVAGQSVILRSLVIELSRQRARSDRPGA